MQVVVLASQKGGSGKTTLSGHLAVEAERVGVGPVVLIDTDPQGSLSDWWNARDAETPAFARVAIEDIAECLFQLREMGVKLAVIDTPPAITQSIASVVAHADLVLIPARPSPHDLRAVGATIDIVEHFNKPLIFVINAATARARITGESAVALSQHGTVAPVTLHHRVDFAASMVNGKTIGEIDSKSKSAREITDLWAYVASRLDRLKGAPVSVTQAPRVSTNLEALSPLAVSAPATEVEKTPVREREVHVAVEPEPLAILDPEPLSEIEVAVLLDPEPLMEREEDEQMEEDFSAAIREGASVAFAFDPSIDLSDDYLPITYQLTRPPADVLVPPPAPHISSTPTYPVVDPHVIDRRHSVFGRRRRDPQSPFAAENHGVEKMR